MLTGNEIKFYCTRTDKLKIEPFVESHVGPNSVDLTLSPELLVYGEADKVSWLQNLETRVVNGLEYLCDYIRPPRLVLDMKKDNPTTKLTIPEEGLVLLPYQFYLGCSNEYTETHGFVPTIETRSSVARLSVCAHLSAGYGDCGFCSNWTLEIVAFEPVRIYPNVRICQIAYTRAEGLETPYQGKYKGKTGPVPSRMWKDFLIEQD